MGRDRAAYMRTYRRSKRGEQIQDTTMPSEVADLPYIAARLRIRELEAEVHRLKVELAGRSIVAPLRSFGAPRPAPKPGK